MMEILPALTTAGAPRFNEDIGFLKIQAAHPGLRGVQLLCKCENLRE
jgi:hypothetical protein